MSTIEKLKQKLKGRPKTYDWNDLSRVLINLGYSENTSGKTSGSRIRFTHPTAPLIILHKPHPGNEMKLYVINSIVDTLEMEELL